MHLTSPFSLLTFSQLHLTSKTSLLAINHSYQRNEVSLGEKWRRFGCSLGQIDGRGFELADALVVDNLLVGPLLVDVDLQVVALNDG